MAQGFCLAVDKVWPEFGRVSLARACRENVRKGVCLWRCIPDKYFRKTLRVVTFKYAVQPFSHGDLTLGHKSKHTTPRFEYDRPTCSKRPLADLSA